VDPLGTRTVLGLQVMGNRAIAVGQRGLVLQSFDSAGSRWGYADLRLPAGVSTAWGFRAVHCGGDHVWIVGRPGSAMLHSADKGQSWETIRTGHPLPLNAVCFPTPTCGCAVGEFGSILGTTDGGKTWHVRHRGGQRSALLFLHA